MTISYRSASIWVAVGALGITLGVGSAQAVESLGPAGPIGGTDIRAALMPPPGLYGGLIGVDFPLGDLPQPNETIPGSGNGIIGGIGLLYVYDFKLLGGSLGTSFFAGYQNVCYAPDAVRPKPCANGLLDIYSDLLLWNFFIPDQNPTNKQGGIVPIPYGLAIQLGFGISFPTGTYSASDSINTGANIYDFVPNISLTYTVPSIFGQNFGQATEFSARLSYNYYTENPATDYKTGAIVGLDFAVTQRWDNWQFGLAGTAWTQIADDTIDGVTAPPDGRRASTVRIGPVVGYDFIMADRPWNFSIKALFPVEAEYLPVPTAISFRLGTKIF